MAKVAILLGTGTAGEDVLNKIQWLRHFDNDHEIHVVSRIGKNHLNPNLKKLYGEKSFNEIEDSINELYKISKSFNFIYDFIKLERKYSNNEIIELQNWLGISFSFITTLDRRFYNREKFQDSRKKEDLINFTAALILFFKKIFTEKKINVFINTIEDDIFSVVAYYVAKRLNIKIIGFMSAKFPKKGFMFCENFKNIIQWNNNLNVDINEIKGLYSDSTLVGKSMMDKTVNYWDFKSSFFKRIKGLLSVIHYHSYANDLIKKYKGEEFIFDPLINPFSQIKKYFIKFFRFLFIKLLIVEPDYNDNYFLFPLHFVEDAQMTFREPLVNQYELIKAVSRSLPLSFYLYVKPHPHYLGTDLSIKRMKELSSLDNVKIINPKTPNIKLIKNSSVLVTINSTTGFESMIMGVPLITLGHDFYCKDDLCRIVRDWNNLSENLTQSLNDSTPKKISSFVKTIYLNTIWVDTINYEYGFSGLNYKDGEKLALALNKILKRIDDEYYS